MASSSASSSAAAVSIASSSASSLAATASMASSSSASSTSASLVSAAKVSTVRFKPWMTVVLGVLAVTVVLGELVGKQSILERQNPANMAVSRKQMSVFILDFRRFQRI